MTRWVISRYRGNRPGLKVLGEGPVPQLAQRIGLGALGVAIAPGPGWIP